MGRPNLNKIRRMLIIRRWLTDHPNAAPHKIATELGGVLRQRGHHVHRSTIYRDLTEVRRDQANWPDGLEVDDDPSEVDLLRESVYRSCMQGDYWGMIGAIEPLARYLEPVRNRIAAGLRSGRPDRRP